MSESLEVAGLQIDLKIAKAERDLCIMALEELERIHAHRCRLSKRQESESKTLRVIRRVLKAVRLHVEISS